MNPAFFDTNILVYCVDARDSRKQTIALDLVRAHSAPGKRMHLSTQVLIEYFRVTTREPARPGAFKMLTNEQARQHLEVLCSHHVHAMTPEMVRSAARLADRYQLQWFDALIVEAALLARVDVLYSEDMHNGLRIGEMQITNPFA